MLLREGSSTPDAGTLLRPPDRGRADTRSAGQLIRTGCTRGCGWLHAQLEERRGRTTITALDGVRAAACLLVVVYHLGLVTTQDLPLWTKRGLAPLAGTFVFAGDSGVMLFFVLSGFLLFLPYARSLLLVDDRWPSARQFYLRRALRILPAYYITLFLIAWLFRPSYFSLQHLGQWPFFLLLFMDSSKATFHQINGPFWTLAVEWQFYLVLPWLALGISLLVRRCVTARGRLALLVASLLTLMGWGLLSRFAGLYYTDHPGAPMLFLPRGVRDGVLALIYGPLMPGFHGKFLEDFGIGMLAATCYVLARRGAWHRKRVARWGGLLMAGGVLCLALMAMSQYNETIAVVWPVLHPAPLLYRMVRAFGYGLGYGLLMLGVLWSDGRLTRIFGWTPLRGIGLLSYGIYMWHLVLLERLTHLLRPLLHSVPGLVLYNAYWLWFAILVVPLAFMLYRFVERPSMALARRVTRRVPSVPAREVGSDRAEQTRSSAASVPAI